MKSPTITLTVHHYTESETVCHATAEVTYVDEVRRLLRNCKPARVGWKYRAICTAYSVRDPAHSDRADALLSKAMRVPKSAGVLPFVQPID